MSLVLNGTDGLSDVDGSAATPAIRGTDANTGIFFPGADRIGFAEGGVQVGEFDASGNFLMNSGYGSAAVVYGCRAWVNFNGTGTVAIRASGNVSSVTDIAVGQYQVNLTTAMPDANYCAVMGAWDDGVSPTGTMNKRIRVTSSSATLISLTNAAGTYADSDQVDFAAFR